MTEHDIRETIRLFFGEIHKWEIDCAGRDAKCEDGLMDYAESEATAMDEYGRIFAKFCSEDATPRDFHYSEPPEYNLDQIEIERVERADETSASVFVNTVSGLKERFVFQLVRERDSWRIKDKYYMSEDGDLIEANL